MICKTKQGFSLVELLIVVAMIMLLIAMLFPIILRVKDKAYLFTCLNNLRSIGMTNHSYAADNKGHIPHYQAIQPDGSELYVGWQNTVPWPLIRAHCNYLAGIDYGEYSSGHTALRNDYNAGRYKELEHFFCPTPKGGSSMQTSNLMTGGSTYLTNYQFRTVNHKGSHGWNGPPGGWILGAHNEHAWIAHAMIWWNEGWGDIIKIEGTDIEPGPYDIQYGNGSWICNGRHTGNQYPVLYLHGGAEAFQYPRTAGRPGDWCRGGWYP